MTDQGYLMSLRDSEVVKAASRYGNPVDLLEAFPVWADVTDGASAARSLR